MIENTVVIGKDRRRWLMLFLFSILEFANAVLWVTFSPISDVTQHYFEKAPYNTASAVNMLANIFLILYLPGTILGSITIKKYGLKNALLLGGVLTSIGSFIRYVAVINNTELGDEGTYYLILFGQALSSLAQPIFLNMPPLLASTWFPVKERELTTTIGAVSSPLGNAFGSYLPVFFVHEEKRVDNTYHVYGFAELMLCQFLICLIPFLLSIVFFLDKPSTPPSMSTYLKDRANQPIVGKVEHLPPNTPPKPSSTSDIQSIICDVKELFQNRNFVLLFWNFSIGYGFFCAILTLVNQIISPYGYDNQDSSLFGLIFSATGVLGSIVIGSIMSKYRKYNTTLKITNIMILLASIFFLLMLYHDNIAWLGVSYAMLGLFTTAVVPVSMNCCAEISYPISDELSVGILLIGANIMGFGLIFLLQDLIELRDNEHYNYFNVFNAVYLSLIVIQNLLLVMYSGDYKRLQYEVLSMSSEMNSDMNEPLIK